MFAMIIVVIPAQTRRTDHNKSQLIIVILSQSDTHNITRLNALYVRHTQIKPQSIVDQMIVTNLHKDYVLELHTPIPK